MSAGAAILVAILLLLGNAFFVGAEFSILSARRSAIEPKAEAGSKAAKTVLWAMEHVSLMLACAQLGVTICSTSLGAVAEPAIANLIEPGMLAIGLPAQASHAVAFVVALLIVVYLHVVVGEMIPKNLAVSGPDKAVMWFGPPLVWISRVVKPIIVVLNALANGVLRLMRVEPKDEVASAFTAEEVASIVTRSQAEGLLNDDHGLLSGALQFSDKTAEDVMVPIVELVSLSEGSSPADLETCVARTGFSRFPVTSSDDRLVGYLHIKDVLYAGEDGRKDPIPRWRVRAMAVVHPSDEVEDALLAMQRSGVHLARVAADDLGQESLGVVFLEDILEELVGEVRDSMQRHGRSGA